MRRVNATTAIKWRNETKHKSVKLFKNGGMRAVRLPAGLDFPPDVSEVIIRREGDTLVMTPRRPDWDSYFGEPPLDEPFLEERNQPRAEPAPELNPTGDD